MPALRKMNAISLHQHLYVYYMINLGSSDRQLILSSIDEYKKLTCLKFTPRTSYDTDYIYFTNGNTGCWSSVGKIGGRQEVYKIC